MANQNQRTCIKEALLLLLVCAMIQPVGGRALAQQRSIDVDRDLASAVRLHEAGDIEGAVRGYLSILASHPERSDVRSNLGAAYSRLGRYEDAIEQYKLALAGDNRN